MPKHLRNHLIVSLLIALWTTSGLAQDLLTEEKIWEMGIVGAPAVHPDGKTAVYSIRYNDLSENKGQSDLYSVDLATAKHSKLTETPVSESQYNWRPDGMRVGFLSASSGSMQLWEMNADGSALKQVSQVEGGIEGYGYSPDGKRIFYIKSVQLDQSLQDRFPELRKSTGMLFDELMYRHWDRYTDGSYNHIFVQAYDNGRLTGEATDLMPGERFHSPLQPFGGTEQMAWSPDGTKLVYTAKKLTGTAAAVSTNADLYMYDFATGATINLTKGMLGYDLNPKFSPDGIKLAWLSMPRDGFEADVNRLMVMTLSDGMISEIDKIDDRSINTHFWGKDGNRLFFGVYENGTAQLYEHFFDLQTAAKTYGLKTKLKGAITNIVTDGAAANYGGFSYVNDGKNGSIALLRQSMLRPNEMYLLDLNDKKLQPLSDVNGKIYEHIKLARIESRTLATSDKKQMQTWVIYPPDFDPNKKYPTLLYCQGGPQSMISQAFSTRWNFFLMASKGYIVVAPNRRGLPGFGQAWNEQISGDWGGQAMQDYFAAIDSMSKEPFVDQDRLGAVGASFGGYSVYWLAGNHEKRFKAFISHCGVYNLEAMYGQTEEVFFTDFEMKGKPWDVPRPKSYDDFSPNKFIGKWDTPILVIHNEKDFRVPLAQGMEAFTAAQLQQIPSKFLYFPDENHWVLKPQNSVLWQKVFFEWLNTYLN